MGQALHLVGRFFGSIRPGPPSADEEAWAIAHLVPGERELWARMSNPDRRHAVRVARELVHRWPEVGTEPPRAVVAAALLHDVGKVDAVMRTPARVAATVVWAFVDDSAADRWLAGKGAGPRARLARYRRHPEIGGRLLREAGADPLTAAWAEQHHKGEERWTVDRGVGRLLKDCDDD